MAITESLKDLENFPSVTKTATLDQVKVIPIDEEGDEVYVVSCTPGTGVVDLNGDTIVPVFIREFKAGFAKSSGFKNAPFNITTSNNTLQVSIDGSTFRSITLASGTGLTGEDVADDLQTKITALAGIGGLEELNIAFLNCLVNFVNNKFLIIAGTVSNTYTGVGKSSVKVLPGATNDASVTLGFDIYLNSEDLSSKQAVETTLSSTYSGGTTLNVNSTSNLSAGEAFTLSNGTNREYFVASGITSTTIGISGTGLINTYSGGSVVQKIFERDSDTDLASVYTTIDDITRFALRAVASQIDFGA